MDSSYKSIIIHYRVLSIYHHRQIDNSPNSSVLFLSSLLTAMYTGTQFCSNQSSFIGLGCNLKKYCIFLMKSAKVFSWVIPSTWDPLFGTFSFLGPMLHRVQMLCKAHPFAADNLRYQSGLCFSIILWASIFEPWMGTRCTVHTWKKIYHKYKATGKRNANVRMQTVTTTYITYYFTAFSGQFHIFVLYNRLEEDLQEKGNHFRFIVLKG